MRRKLPVRLLCDGVLDTFLRFGIFRDQMLGDH
jgi:hypothetical protein